MMSPTKIRSFLVFFIKIVLVVLFFFCIYKIAGVPITHIITFVIAFFFLLRKKNIQGLKSLFIVDLINKYQFGILAAIIFTYIIKQNNIGELEKFYTEMTGSTVSNLYIKMALNGILSVLLYIFAYNIGRSFNGNYEKMRRILIFLVLLCTINGFANIIEWIATTGGSIGRYNFIPPLIPSQGTSIGFSIFGFMLALGIFDKKRGNERLFFYFSFVVLLFSIVIIMSRQPQVTFLLKIAIFLLLIRKPDSNKPFTLYLFAFGIVLLFLYLFLIASTVFSSNYIKIFSEDSTDIAVRLGPIITAFNLFYNNIVTGIGYGMFGLYTTTIPVWVGGIPIFLASTHNGFAGIACEMGLLGLILNFFLLLTINKKLYRTTIYLKKSNQSSFKFAASFLSTFIMSTILLFISNYFLFPPPSEYDYASGSFITWLLLGMVLSFESKSSAHNTQIDTDIKDLNNELSYKNDCYE